MAGQQSNSHSADAAAAWPYDAVALKAVDRILDNNNVSRLDWD